MLSKHLFVVHKLSFIGITSFAFAQNTLHGFLNNVLTLYSIDTHFAHQQQTAFENIVGKEEIARDEQFLLFPQCFLLNQITVSPFVHIFDIISLFAAELEEPKLPYKVKD